MIVRVASVTCFALLLCQPAFADEPSYTRHRHRSYSAAPHVVELVAPPFSGRFVINGFRYDGVAPACLRWVPGQPVRLVSAGGSAIATAPRFTTCPRAPLARHCVEAAHGGEGALAESFGVTGVRPLAPVRLDVLAKLQEVHLTLEPLGEANGRYGRI